MPRWDAEVQAAVTQARRLYAHAPDPALVHAVIERETRHGAFPITGTHEPNGRTSYGPMQVMDTTAQRHGISDPKTLAVPAIGIRIGTFELARLMGVFPADTARAIAGYNAGQGNTTRNAQGRFFNQAYVDAVLSFWRGAGGAAPVAGLLALGVILFAVATGRRRGRAFA